MADLQSTLSPGRAASDARLRIVRKHQPWSSVTRRLEVAIDGVPIGELDQGEVVEGWVAAGTHVLAVRPGRGSWHSSTVHLEPGSSRGILVATSERHRTWRTLVEIALAMVTGSPAFEAGDPEVDFDDPDRADPGRPANVTRVVWLVLAVAVAATFVVEPFAGALVALVGLITVLLARVQAGARRHLRRPDVPPPWTRTRLSLR